MKKIVFILCIILLVMINLVGCWGDKEKQFEEDNLIEIKYDEEEQNENGQILEGIPSTLSHMYASEEKVNRRPVAVMFDNHPKARWQSGLSQAEIVYEFLVEHPYTRYMGIYLINDPKHLGPIRSSRPYFVTTLLEYDPIYVRVGGSVEAKKDIKDFNIADIDGLSSSSKVFWRYNKTGKKKPHNLYTNMEVIRNTQLERDYKQDAHYESFKFNAKDENIEGYEAKNIFIKYNEENNTNYKYDSDNKNYKRYKDGELHIDEFYKTPIIAKNIIIQYANTKTIDKDGRLAIDLVGKGNGVYITNGKAQEITWVKNARNSKTYFYNCKGEEIKFNPGVTWIQVTKLKTDIDIY